MNRQAWVYLAQLTRALQQEGVDGRRAGEFVAEIDSHLTETGADPVDEFGPPFELAAKLARRPGSRRPGWIPPTWAMSIVAIIAGLVFVVVLDTIMLGWDDTGVPIRASGLVYMAVFLPLVVVFTYGANRRLSGRNWTAVAGGRSMLVALAIGIVVTTAATMVGGRVLAHVPVPLFWGTVAVVVPLLTFLLIKHRNPVRFPDHAKHLRRLKLGPLAGQPPAEWHR